MTIAAAALGLTFSLGLCVPLLAPPVASADVVIGEPGTGAGQYLRPEGVAFSPAVEELYVADRENHRIDVFSVDGEFRRAFGWGVVASGPGNDPRDAVQRVSVNAGSGSFTLRLNLPESFPSQETSGPIAVGAGATAFQAALEEAAIFSPGDVSVTGAAGGPWTVEFGGSLADTGLPEFTANTTGLSGGTESVAVDVIQEGANFEICEPAEGDVCRAGQEGGDSGQMTPMSVAVDADSGSAAFGAVYVYDEPGNRVQVFDAEGQFLRMFGGEVNTTTGEDVCVAGTGDECGAGARGFGPGQFSESGEVAVGPGGVVHVADSVPSGAREARVQRFEPDGERIDEFEVDNEGVGRVEALAVDSSSNVYVATSNSTGAVRRFDAGGTCLNCGDPLQPSFNIRALAVGDGDDLLVADTTQVRAVYQYDSAEDPLLTIYGSLWEAGVPSGLAAHSSADGDLFVSQGAGAESRIVYVSFPPPGPVVHPAPALTNAAPVSNTKATLNAEINPEGEATTYWFQYVDEQSFQESGFSGPNVVDTPEVPLEVGAGDPFRLHTASQQVGCAEPQNPPQPSCLIPETSYRFRAVASNVDGGPVTGPTAAFTTLPPLEIAGTWASDVGLETARLSASVNPLGIPSTGYFEYVTEASFEASGFEGAARVPDVDGGDAPLDFGAGEAAVTRSAETASLVAGTEYRFRVVIENSFDSFEGPVREFRTFAPPEPDRTDCPNQVHREGLAGQLPDCRAYEMVSPVDKEGGEIVVQLNTLDEPAGFEQATPGGGGLTYSSYRAFGDAEAAPYASQYIAARSEGAGWGSEAISPPRTGPVLGDKIAALDSEYQAFTEDLSFAWLFYSFEPSLDPGTPSGFPSLYRRSNATGAYRGLVDVVPPSEQPNGFLAELQGATPDGSRAIFAANDTLTPDAPELSELSPNTLLLYESTAEGLSYVCILPNDEPHDGTCTAGTRNAGGFRYGNVDNAISSDGSRVFWSDRAVNPGKIYLRIDGEDTIPVSSVGEGLSESEGSRFWMASTDGSRAVFTTGGDLYLFEVATEETSFIAGEVAGVAAASDDARRIYFASLEDLDGAEGLAEAGEPNLYLYDDGDYVHVATLTERDTVPGGAPSPVRVRATLHVAQATADGGHLAFMSTGSLTGADNKDASSGAPAAEVFRYTAASDALVCVSCNPTGGRPRSEPTPAAEAEPYWVAGRIPGWRNQLYVSRYLSADGGRVLFESFQGLVPGDTNDNLDVYQWEVVGRGDCDSDKATFNGESGGCVDLISAAEGPEPSEFVDAGASGDAVFFKTSVSLVPQDSGLVDIYTASVGGGFAPPTEPPAPCEGAACQDPDPPPDSPSPSSSTFVGPGNLAAAPPVDARGCRRAALRAKRMSGRAQRVRRVARRVSRVRLTRRLNRRARRFATAAKRSSLRAQRCRREVRRAAR